jgi:hypothetical protein
VRIKELQIQKARIVAQMVPAQVLHTTESPFEDAESVVRCVSECARRRSMLFSDLAIVNLLCVRRPENSSVLGSTQ